MNFRATVLPCAAALMGACFTLQVNAANLVVEQATLPADAIDADAATAQPFVQTFTFALSGTGIGAPGIVYFELGDGDSWSANRSGYAIPAGTYYLVETQPDGKETVVVSGDPDAIELSWSLSSVRCLNQAGASVDPVGMQLAADDTVTCTFTSELSGALVVDHRTDPSGVSDEFDFSVSGSDGFSDSFTLGDTDAPRRFSVEAGTHAYSISRASVSGWTGDITCSNNDPATAVQVAAGEVVECVSSVRQVDPTRIRVTKQCQNSDNGERFEISLYEDDEFVESREIGCTESTIFTVDPDRLYSIVESPTAGWVQFTGNCNWPNAPTTAAIPHSPRPGTITDCVMVNEWAVSGVSVTKTALTPSIYAGDDARFLIRVVNTGNTPLTDVRVSDVLAPACDRQQDLLEVGGDFEYECVLVSVPKSVVNEAVVTTKEGVSGSDDAKVEVVSTKGKATPSNRITLSFITVPEDPSAVVRLRFGDSILNRDFRHGDTWTSGLLGEHTMVIGIADLPAGAVAAVLCDNNDQGIGSAAVVMNTNEAIACTISYSAPSTGSGSAGGVVP